MVIPALYENMTCVSYLDRLVATSILNRQEWTSLVCIEMQKILQLCALLSQKGR